MSVLKSIEVNETATQCALRSSPEAQGLQKCPPRYKSAKSANFLYQPQKKTKNYKINNDDVLKIERFSAPELFGVKAEAEEKQGNQ